MPGDPLRTLECKAAYFRLAASIQHVICMQDMRVFVYMQLEMLYVSEFVHEIIVTERDGIAIPEMTKLFESHLYSAHMPTYTVVV